MPCITVRRPAGPAVLFRLEQDQIRIGRGPENDLVVRDASVSRLHAEIRREGNGWILEDKGSLNGTKLGGKPVSGSCRLSSGDEIHVGAMVLLFDDSTGEEPADAAQEATSPVEEEMLPVAQSGLAFIGESPAIRRVRGVLKKLGPSNAGVLIVGENGTGKEIVARLIHEHSPRSGGPFVVVNCPALPGSLIESELFGVEDGVATGVAARIGLFEVAQGGTVFLDEIGDMDPAAQAKLLRVLQDKTLERIGGREPVALDVRILAATNHDLEDDMERGAFRRDLFHRLSMFTVQLPPLRDRPGDIPLLVGHFLNEGEGCGTEVSEEAMEFLLRYEYPGNVRELKHFIQGASFIAEGPVIELEHLEATVHLGVRKEISGQRSPAHGAAEELYRRIVHEGGSFWDLVGDPFMARTLSREEARRFVRISYERAGESYKEMARLFRIEEEYKKFLNFLRYHSLRVKR